MVEPRIARKIRSRAPLVRGAATVALAGVLAIAPVGCSDDGSPSKPGAGTPSSTASTPAPTPTKAAEPKPAETAPAAPPTQEQLVERGKSVYMANCIACHAMNPAKDGALGPAVAGASRDLLAARVLRGEYPEGYTPKRDSKAMIALPHLEPDIDALAAYLQSVK